ncbi:MAG: DUF2171 domain-containing protein [Thermoproteota archaeon]|nr:DUF2171 domain-containing protein [Thermoproteota archaeon]
MSEPPRGYDISKIDFETLKNKSVNTSDGILLGKIDSISNNHFIITKNMTDRIHYFIPFDEVNRVDGDVLWLGITDKDASRHILSLTDDDDKDNSKVEYETVTFRLNENVMNGIRSEAENGTTSVNNFVNYILKRFTDSDKFKPQTGMIYINRPVVIEIFNKKSYEEIVHLAKFIAKDAICNTILFTHGKKDLDTFLLWIENEMNKHSFTVRHITDGNSHKYIIRHEMGYKFSLFYKTIIEEIFQDNLKEKNIEFILSDEILLFVFEK